MNEREIKTVNEEDVGRVIVHYMYDKIKHKGDHIEFSYRFSAVGEINIRNGKIQPNSKNFKITEESITDIGFSIKI